MVVLRLSALLAAIAVCVPRSFAAAPKTEPAATPAMPLGGGAVLELLLGLALVLVVIFVLAWLARRFGAGAWMQARGMRVLASLPLGTRERAVLVEVGGKQLLLGVTPQQVNLLQAFDEPVVEASAAPSGEFAERLRDALGRRGSS